MGLVINNSSDITFLSVQVIFDISGTLPLIEITNQSQGPNLAGVSYAFQVLSPTQTYIHNGSLDDPDITGIWSTGQLADNWPRPFNNIEYSGAPYSFQVLAKDSNGNKYAAPVQLASICRPNGNLPTSKNTFGKGDVLVQVKCDQARILFQDITNTSYKGLTGTIGSSVLRVNFPMDDTGTVPAPFVGGNFSTAMVPITYSGKGYQFLYTSIYQYELAEDTFVRIKYLLSNTFGVFCNIDLMPLLCEYQKLIASIESGSCNDVAEANRKLMLINPKFSLVVMGILQPLIGVDVPALIQEIEAIGDFPCDCCNVATGITPPGSSAFDGYTFSVVPLGGDINGQVVANGFNIQIQLSDISYVFKICDTSPAQTTAFSVIPTSTSYNKTYCLQVDITQLSEDILNTIADNSALVNLFNSIVLSSGDGNFNLTVDGSCIFATSATCDYIFTLSTIPVNTTFSLLTSIKIAGIVYPINFAFNLTNLPALQTYLNGLGYGTFAVTNPSGQTVLISSTNNGNDIQQLNYKVSTTNLIAGLSKDCTGFVPVSANFVVQQIINYLCAINDSQVITSSAYVICYIDPTTKLKVESPLPIGVSLATFISELLARGCNTIDYIINSGSVNCANIKAQFPELNTVAMQPNDIFLVTKAGACSQITPNEAFLTLLTYGIDNPDVVTAFCAFVNACQGGLPCAPYDVFFIVVNEGSPTSIVDLVVTFSHPDAISNTIRYARIDNTVTPVYTTIPGILPGDSPYTISGVANGQYRVYLRPIYSDGRLCTETFVDTPACTGINSFSVAYDGTNINVTYSASGDLDAVRVNISYPNGGSFSQIYANGDPIVIAPPPGVFGTFFVTMQPVCNVNSGFFGVATPPSTFIINPPFNSVIINNSSLNQSFVGIFSLVPALSYLDSTPLNIAATQAFYIGDGTYGQLFVRVDGADRDLLACTLVTGTGTYSGIPYSTNRFLFTSVSILAGCTITLTDDASPSLGDFIVTNSSATGQIDSITPVIYSIVSGSFPVSNGQELDATHTGFASILNVAVSGITGNTKVELFKNGVLQQCITFISDGNNNFAAFAFNPGDLCEFVMSDGGCA